MSWNRHDPIEEKRRRLAEQERLLAERMSRLREDLSQSGRPAPELKPEPPVWRMEEEGHSPHRPARPAPARKRNLARQRQRDMVLFFILIFVLILVAAIALYIAKVRNMGPINGALNGGGRIDGSTVAVAQG